LIEWLSRPAKEDPWVGIHLTVIKEHASLLLGHPEEQREDTDGDSTRVEVGSIGNDRGY
jgi:hypothetical protein